MPCKPRQVVLIITQDDRISDSLSRSLAAAGYEPARASSCEAAVVALEPIVPGALLVDLAILAGTRAVVCRRLRTALAGHEAAVVAFTTGADRPGADLDLPPEIDDVVWCGDSHSDLLRRLAARLREREKMRCLRLGLQRMRALSDACAALAEGLRSEDPLEKVLEIVRQGFQLETAAVGLRGERGIETRGAAPRGSLERARAMLAAREAKSVLESGRPGRRLGPAGAWTLWIPIQDAEAALGVLSVEARRTDFAGDETEALGAFCRHLALAERNRRLLDGYRVNAENLETTIRERTATLERQIRFTGQIIDSLPVSLYVVDRDRTIVAWNRQRELGDRGIRRESVLGKNLHDVFDQQPRESIEAELVPAFEQGESTLFERDTVVNGELRHFRIRKLPMRLEPGEVTHVLTIGEDITEQRRMEKSMVVTEKMAAMGRLAAGVAHEINNPLATIVTCAEGLRSRLPGIIREGAEDPDFLEYLQIVEQEAYRAKRITEDLLDFSRVRPSPRRPQGLERILDRTLLILKHHDGFKRIELERRFEPDLPPVYVEEDAIVQALVVLIINALDAMPDGGRLILTTSVKPGEVWCEVRDTGCGIRREDLPQIFEPFFTTKPPGRGTGLGLAVCYGIVKAHGGRIEVDSAHGEGSRFTVILPAVPTGAGDVEEHRECSLPSPSGS